MGIRVVDPNKDQQAKSTNSPLESNEGLNTDISTTSSSNINPSSAAPSPSQSPTPTTTSSSSSGSSPNIKNYVKSAKGAGDRIASSMQSNLANQIRKGQTNIKNTQTEFSNVMDRQSGYAATEEGRRQAISNATGYASKEGGYKPPQMPQRGSSASTQGYEQQQPANPSNFQESDFKDVINKEYTGIKRADETNQFGNVLQSSSNLRDSTKLINDPTRSDELMRATFGNANQPYTQGMSALDSLLYNTSGSAAKLKQSDPFQQASSFDSNVDSMQKDLSRSAMDRGQQIQEMRDRARSEFLDVARNRTSQVDDRVGDVIQNWDNITNALRDQFVETDPATGEKKTLKGNIEVNPLATALMGIGNNSQFFNLLKDEASLNDFIKSTDYDRNRLVSKQEQGNLARLEALSKLANSTGMEYNNKYYDAGRAGTMSAADALDRENIRNKLSGAMGDFKNEALRNITETGHSSGSYRSGLSKKSINEYRDATGSLDNILSKSGYKYEQDLPGSNNSVANIASAVEEMNRLKDPSSTEKFMNMVSTDLKNAIAPALTGGAAMLLPGSSIPGKEILREGANKISGLVKDIGFTDVSKAISNFTNALGGNKSQKIGEHAAAAQAIANNKLANTLTSNLQKSGFHNQATSADMSKTENQAKHNALLQLLSNMDKTNMGNY